MILLFLRGRKYYYACFKEARSYIFLTAGKEDRKKGKISPKFSLKKRALTVEYAEVAGIKLSEVVFPV